MAQPKHLGKKVGQFESPSKDILDTFPNPGVGVVKFHTTEMTSLCPVTGQPDWEEVTISYMPLHRCVESKSLKLYLQSYRMEHSFMESLSRRIWDDLSEVLNPIQLSVTVKCTPRGGISLEAYTDHKKRHPLQEGEDI